MCLFHVELYLVTWAGDPIHLVSECQTRKVHFFREHSCTLRNAH
jgi:hypothetical protein